MITFKTKDGNFIVLDGIRKYNPKQGRVIFADGHEEIIVDDTDRVRLTEIFEGVNVNIGNSFASKGPAISTRGEPIIDFPVTSLQTKKKPRRE